MGLGRGLERVLTFPLLVLNFILAVIILGIAGRVLNKRIDGEFEGNGATLYLTLFAILAGVAAVAAIITGFHHLFHWNPSTGASAQATSWIAWLLLAVAFCLAWKEIHIGGRSTKLKALEAFVILLTITKLLYTLALHVGEYGGYDKSGGGRFLNPNANRNAEPARAAPAV